MAQTNVQAFSGDVKINNGTNHQLTIDATTSMIYNKQLYFPNIATNSYNYLGRFIIYSPPAIFNIWDIGNALGSGSRYSMSKGYGQTPQAPIVNAFEGSEFTTYSFYWEPEAAGGNSEENQFYHVWFSPSREGYYTFYIHAKDYLFPTEPSSPTYNNVIYGMLNLLGTSGTQSHVVVGRPGMSGNATLQLHNESQVTGDRLTHEAIQLFSNSTPATGDVSNVFITMTPSTVNGGYGGYIEGWLKSGTTSGVNIGAINQGTKYAGISVVGTTANVGIGLTNPGVKLQIKGTSAITLTTANGPSYSDYGQLVITDSTVPSGTSTLGSLKIGYDASTGSFGTGFIQCVVPNVYSPSLVLNPYGGNVGIGTTNPYQGNLTVYGLGADPYFSGFVVGNYADASDFTGLAHFKSSGSHGAIRVSNSADYTGSTRIDFNTRLSDFWNINTPSSSYFRGTAPTAGRIMVSGEINSNYEDSYMTFHTCRDLRVDGIGGTGNLYERMRITSTGNVGIGTNNPTTALQISRNFTANDDTSAMISFENTGTNFYDWRIGPTVIDGSASFVIKGGADGFGNLSNVFVIKDTSVGIGTTNPRCGLDVQKSGTRCSYPFGIGGSSAYASRVEFTVTGNNNAAGWSRDIVVGVFERGGWIRVFSGATFSSGASNGAVQSPQEASFVYSIYGNYLYWNRVSGSTNISLSNVGYQTIRISVSGGGSYVWGYVEAYQEGGVAIF
jgi:hypothetical protein